MITQNNLKEVLEILGFESLSTGGGGKKPKSKSLESKIAESNKLESKKCKYLYKNHKFPHNTSRFYKSKAYLPARDKNQ